MQDLTQSRPAAHTIREAAREAKIGRTLLYEAIKSGNLRARKSGAAQSLSTMICEIGSRRCPSLGPRDDERF